MPILPRPQRLTLHDAINYVAERCKCETEKAGKAVYGALREDALRAIANKDIRDPDQPRWLSGYVDTGLHPVPSKLWSSYRWSDFRGHAVHPRGNPRYRERTADGQGVGPIYRAPTIATTDIDAWLDRDDGNHIVPAGAGKEKGMWETLYEAIQLKPGAFGFAIDLKPIFNRARRYLGFR